MLSNSNEINLTPPCSHNGTGVFKVPTIGDCYLATSGLPDIQDDHAEVMAIFLVECQNIFEVVTT